jgi:hypothetical protein
LKRTIETAIAISAIAFAAGCKRDLCTSASPAIMIELDVSDPGLRASIRSLEVTLAFNDHRFRRQYSISDQLSGGSTTIFVALDPPPSMRTAITVGVRGWASDDGSGATIVETTTDTTIEADACNAWSVALQPNASDAGLQDAGLEHADGGVEEAGPDAEAPDIDSGSTVEDASPIDATDSGSMPIDAAAMDAAPPDAAIVGPIHRAITIDNTANPATLTSYVVEVVFDTASPIRAGHLQADGRDLRFWDSDGVTPLPYWIGSGIDTATTSLWVKVPSITGGGTKTIALSYRDPMATAATNGGATFLYYADFDSASLGNDGSQDGLTPVAGLWSVVSGGYRGNGYEEAGTASRQSVFESSSFSDVAVSVRIRLPSTVSSGVNGLYVRAGDVDDVYFFGPFQATSLTFGKYSAGVYASLSEIVTAVQQETWHEITLAASGATFRGYLDRSLVIMTTDSTFASGKVGLRTWGTAARFDELRVRPFSAPEPRAIVGPEY